MLKNNKNSKFYFDKSLITWILRILGYIFIALFVKIMALFVLVLLHHFDDYDYVIKYCYIFFICALIIILYILLIKIICRKPWREYVKHGLLKEWYLKNVETIGLEWIRNIYEIITSKGLLKLKDNKIIFVSPTANEGSFEKGLYKYLLEKKIECTFIVSDKAELERHEANEINQNSKYVYIEKKDANDIVETLKDCKIEKTNILWDFKGNIWYLAESKNHNKYDKIIKAFENYKNVLADDGIIVIDNFNSNKSSLNSFYKIFLGLKVVNGERSTAQKIDKLITKKRFSKGQEKLKKYFDKNFITYDIEADQEKHPGIKVRVYKKRIIND